MIIARQSTARTVMIGPVLDADGVAVTDAAVSDLKISKNGGAPAALNGSATLTHRHTGHYSLALTASDLDTVGQAEIVIDDTTNACPVKEITVIEEAVYDINFAASATGAVPVASIANNAITASAIASDAITSAKIADNAITANKIASDAITAAKIATGAIDADAIADGAIDAGAIASNAIALAKIATDTRNAFGLNLSGTLSGTHSDTTADLGTNAPTEDVSGQTLFFPAHQLSRVITSYNTGTGVATFESIGVTLANSDVWHLHATAPASGGGLDAAGVRAAIGMSSANLDTQLSGLDGKLDTIDNFLDTEVSAILADTNELQTDWANGGRLDLILDARASQTSVDTIDDLLDTEIGALTTELAKVPKSDGTASWNATALAAIQQEATDALNAYDPPTNAEMVARTLASASYATATAQATAQGTLDKLDDTLEDQGGGTFGFTEASLQEAPSGTGASAQSIVEAMFQNDSGETAASAVAGSAVYEIVNNSGGGSADWSADERTAIRAILGIPASGTTPADPSTGILDTIRDAVATRASQTSVDDLPTNAELATALDPLPTAAENATAVWAAGTRTLTALDEDNTTLDLDATIRGAVGLASANLDTQLDALPTAAEGATAVWAAGARTLTAIDEDSTTLDLDGTIRAAVGMASADLDTQLAALPTAGENADAVWDEQVDGTVTARQSVRLANSALGGKASGLETTEAKYRDLADSKDRIVASVDEFGNRLGVVRDLS